MAIKKQTVYKMNYSDFDDIVNEAFPGSNYEFVADIEGNNDECHSYTVEPNDITQSEYFWYRTDWEKFLNGHWDFMAGKILDQLCFMGKIPAGEYVIKINW